MKGSTASPAKSALEEVRRLRKLHRETVRAFSKRIEADLAEVISSLTAELGREDGARLHDIREMTMLLRKLEVKPAKGRRRDMKRIESTVEELQHLSKDW